MKIEELLKQKGLRIKAMVIKEPLEVKDGHHVKVEKDVDLLKVEGNQAYCRVDGKHLHVIPKADLLGYKGELDAADTQAPPPAPEPPKEVGKLYTALLPASNPDGCAKYVKGKLVKEQAVVKVLAVEGDKITAITQDEKKPVKVYIPKADLVEECKPRKAADK